MEVLSCDFLVIGSGISGLYTTYYLSELGDVILITKATISESNTSYAQGGIASVLSEHDSYQSHIEDTLKAGAGLCDPKAVEILVKEGPTHIYKLLELGANFDRTPDGKLHLNREAGHSHDRIVHSKDLTGKEVVHVLMNVISKKKNVLILEHHVAVELITQYHVEEKGDPILKESVCYGAYVYSRKTWDIFPIYAKATILATGGAGQVYLHNTNPDVATGDGVALAYKAGATITNMEFYQFHPTSLYSPNQPPFLITEALRGYGAKLLNIDGEPFMHRYDERLELAPRDVVARAIDAEMKKTGSPHVYLDITHKNPEETKEKFPTIYQTCLERGIDITKQWIPVVPAAHYMCGGVEVDLWGRTKLKGLFAVGEVAHTGVHGGNRLASNSLLEGLVFGYRIYQYLKLNPIMKQNKKIKPWNKDGLNNPEEWILVQHNLQEIKTIMWNYVGIVRSNLRLQRALRRLELLYDEVMDFYRRTVIQNKILELRNITIVAKIITLSALHRKESRGLHYSTDYPENKKPSKEYTRILRLPEKEFYILKQ
ncbi:MAG: L-aspartate oxidase [Leptospiraceae bacterium]|nr:L-aspartate oxidase [Leptospiraceae bacterium]MDW7975146.1 L-aspartate oxidase [Leptospiraceae bacterium]